VFTATIWPHPSFAGSSIPPSRQSGGVSGGVNGGVGDLGRGNVARRRQAVLDELTSVGGLSARELSERLEVGSRTLNETWRFFARLVGSCGKALQRQAKGT
jgi:hypothetical protein